MHREKSVLHRHAGLRKFGISNTRENHTPTILIKDPFGLLTALKVTATAVNVLGDAIGTGLP